MDEASILTTKDTIDILTPIIVAIITWFLARIKNPDYGKKDWKCKEVRSSFGTYTIFLVIIFILPLLAYMFSITVQIIYIEPLLGLFITNTTMPNTAIKIYLIIVALVIYYITYRIAKGLKPLFVPKNIKKITIFMLNVIIYCPIVLNCFVSMSISVNMDISYYTNGITVLIIMFQIIGMVILEDKKSYKNKKMTIVMKDGDSISSNVENVYKKGKWLRIIEQKVPRKEKLIIFEDIKSIEYFD